MRLRIRALPLALLVAHSASITWAAPPAMAPVQFGKTALNAPSGWTRWTEDGAVPILHIDERRGDQSSPSLVFFHVPPQIRGVGSAGGIAAQRLADQLAGSVFTDAKLADHRRMSGAEVRIYDGRVGGRASRIAVIFPADGSWIAAFAAPKKPFAQLGGHKLAAAFVGLDAAAAARFAGGGGTLDIPTKFHRSATPTIDFLADRWSDVSARQAALGLRQLNGTERTVAAVYPAFMSMVHARACQADPYVTVQTVTGPITCAMTIRQWQQTLALLGGDQRQALVQANSERSQIQIAWKCTTGEIDRGSCSAYGTAVRKTNDMAHETSIRIISNMGEDGCVVGRDANCVP